MSVRTETFSAEVMPRTLPDVRRDAVRSGGDILNAAPGDLRSPANYRARMLRNDPRELSTQFQDGRRAERQLLLMIRHFLAIHAHRAFLELADRFAVG